MNSSMSGVVAVAISLMVWAVARKIGRDVDFFRSHAIPVCMAVLTFAGLMQLPEGWCGGILLLYAALALTMLVLLLFLGFPGRRCDRSRMLGEERRGDKPSQHDGQNGGHSADENGGNHHGNA